MLNGKGRSRDGRGTQASGTGREPSRKASGILCFGGATIDRTYAAERPIRPGTSNPATGTRSFGGVAHNVAVNLARLGVPASLVSVVGEDENGVTLVRHLEAIGVDAAGVSRVAGQRTAEYVALLEPDRSLAVGLADMAIFDTMMIDSLASALRRRGNVAWIFTDCNVPAAVLRALMSGPARGSARLALDAVSTPKVERLPPDLNGIDLLFLNRDEAMTLLGPSAAALSPEQMVRLLRSRGVRQTVLTLGAEGLVLGEDAEEIHRIPAVSAKVMDVTGAGDAAIATTLAFLLGGGSLIEAARWGTLAAALTIEQIGSVHPALSKPLLERCRHRLSGHIAPAHIPEHTHEQCSPTD